MQGIEGWTEKDLIYVIGHVPKGTDTLKTIWLVMGDCYAAREPIYKKLHDEISEKIKLLTQYEHNTTTKELGGIRNADPHSTSHLRCHPMWVAEHPANVFKEFYELNNTLDFQLISILLKAKFDSLPIEDKQNIVNDTSIVINDISINDPDNINNKLEAKIITYNN